MAQEQEQDLTLPKLWPGQRIKSELRELHGWSLVAFMATGSLCVLANAVVWTSAGADVGRLMAAGGLVFAAAGSWLVGMNIEAKTERLEDSVTNAVVNRFEALREANPQADVTVLVRKAAELD